MCNIMVAQKWSEDFYFQCLKYKVAVQSPVSAFKYVESNLGKGFNFLIIFCYPTRNLISVLINNPSQISAWKSCHWRWIRPKYPFWNYKQDSLI